MAERNGHDGAYRLPHNPRVTIDDLLQLHREATAERGALETSVLLVQGTTTLNYSGLHVPAGLALLEGGQALGVFWLRPWRRLPEVEAPEGGRKRESERWLEGFEEAAGLGRAWPHTHVVTVCDREGDIFKLLQRHARAPGAAGLLVRAYKAR